MVLNNSISWMSDPELIKYITEITGINFVHVTQQEIDEYPLVLAHVLCDCTSTDDIDALKLFINKDKDECVFSTVKYGVKIDEILKNVTLSKALEKLKEIYNNLRCK